jgi:hypothetical protein
MVKHKHIIILTILFILLSGCVSNNTTYVGTYYKDQSNYITLNPDGTFIVNQDSTEGGGFTGTYEVNTDKTGVMTIFLKFADGDSIMTIGNKTILVDRQGDKWTKG